MSLRDRVITEYGGIGGRVAGARHPHSVPPPASINHDQMTPERDEKLSRMLSEVVVSCDCILENYWGGREAA